MTETGIQLAVFFSIAYFSGMAYPVFYALIGKPGLAPHPDAPTFFPHVSSISVTAPAMIFRAYGRWLAKKQMAFEEKHDKSRVHIVSTPSESIETVTSSYGREIGPELITSFDVFADGSTRREIRLLPGESLSISTGGKTYYAKPMYPNFNLSKMPLSPYKAMGLCGICTVYWIMILAISGGYFMGFYPGYFFYMLPLSYAVAYYGSTLFEI